VLVARGKGEANVKLMESDYDKPLNIGSEELISTDQLADMIIGISGKRLKSGTT
jgi:hypothetical protein